MLTQGSILAYSQYILIAIEDVGCCCLAYVLLLHGARCAYHISTSNQYILIAIEAYGGKYSNTYSFS